MSNTICLKINECRKILRILDQDIETDQYYNGIKIVCAKCNEKH